MADGAGVFGAAAIAAGGTVWNDAAVADLWKWWPEGVSALQISRRLTAAYGRTYTRCSVIAKVHREKGLADMGRDKATAPSISLGLPANRFAWTPDRRKMAIRMDAEGADGDAIAAAINALPNGGERVSPWAVRSVLQRHRERENLDISGPISNSVWSREAGEVIGKAWQSGLSGAEVAVKYTGKLDGGRELSPSSVRYVAERAGYARSEGAARITVQQSNRLRVRKAPAPKATGFNAPALTPPVVFGNIVIRRPDTQREVVEVTGMLALPLWQRPDNGCCFVCGEAGNGEALYCSLPVDRNTRQKTYCAGHHNNMRRPSPHKVIAPPAEGPRRIAAPKADSFLGRWA